MHYSFSVLGLAIILLIGAVAIPASSFLEEILDAIAKFPRLRQSSRFRYACAEWRANSTLQLQRQAHEGLGLGTWSRTNESVPVTIPNENLGVLDISDESHPRLVRPSDRLKTTQLNAEIDDTEPKRNSNITYNEV
jgi:hypothetical protein